MLKNTFSEPDQNSNGYWNHRCAGSYYANKIKPGKNSVQYRDRVIDLFEMALKVLFDVQ